MVSGGVTTGNTPMFYLPTGSRPPIYLHMPAQSYNGNGIVGLAADGGVLSKETTSNTWNSIHAVFVNSSRGTGSTCTTQWCSLAMAGGWVPYDTATYPAPLYTKTSDGMVYLRGLVRSGSTTLDGVIATLPAGYRPSNRLLFETQNTGALGRIDVDASGNVRFVSGSNGWLSFDGISFMAEQ